MAQKQDIPDDKFARDSFSMRRMTRGQVRALAIAATVVLVALLVYGLR